MSGPATERGLPSGRAGISAGARAAVRLFLRAVRDDEERHVEGVLATPPVCSSNVHRPQTTAPLAIVPSRNSLSTRSGSPSGSSSYDHGAPNYPVVQAFAAVTEAAAWSVIWGQCVQDVTSPWLRVRCPRGSLR
jgi:hypothetical protein